MVVKDDHKVRMHGNADHVLYKGLLAMAHEKYGATQLGITVNLLQVPSAENGETAICEATVILWDGAEGVGRYVDIGDASPANVSKGIRPHIIRMASTRAKARALRDALNTGEAAEEELGDARQEPEEPPASRKEQADLAQAITTSGRTLDAFVENVGPIEYLPRGVCVSWTRRFEREIEKAREQEDNGSASDEEWEEVGV